MSKCVLTCIPVCIPQDNMLHFKSFGLEYCLVNPVADFIMIDCVWTWRWSNMSLNLIYNICLLRMLEFELNFFINYPTMGNCIVPAAAYKEKNNM